MGLSMCWATGWVLVLVYCWYWQPAPGPEVHASGRAAGPRQARPARPQTPRPRLPFGACCWRPVCGVRPSGVALGPWALARDRDVRDLGAKAASCERVALLPCTAAPRRNVQDVRKNNKHKCWRAHLLHLSSAPLWLWLWEWEWESLTCYLLWLPRTLLFIYSFSFASLFFKKKLPFFTALCVLYARARARAHDNLRYRARQGLGRGTGQTPRCPSVARLASRPPARATIKGPSSAWSIWRSRGGLRAARRWGEGRGKR
jgi:hypothetical protein